MENVNKTRFHALRQTGDDGGVQRGPAMARDMVKAPKLGAGNYLKIAFQSFISSFSSDKSAREIRSELKSDIIEAKKTQTTERAERRDARNFETKADKNFSVPNLKQVFVDGEKSFLTLSSAFFKKDPIAFLSKTIDGFVEQAKGEGATTHQEVRELLKETLPHLTSTMLFTDILPFDKQRFDGYVQQYRSEFRNEKADILSDIVTAMDSLLDPKGDVKQFDRAAMKYMNSCVEKQVSSQGKDTNFLRSNDYTNLGIVMHGLGLKELATLSVDIVGDLRKDKTLNALAKDKTLENVKLQSADMKPDTLQQVCKVAHKVLDSLAAFTPSKELKAKMDQYCDPIRTAVHEGRMEKGLAKDLIRQFYANAIFLRVANPSLLYAAGGDMEKARGVMTMITQVIQNIANDTGVEKFQSPKAKEEFLLLRPALAEKVDSLFVKMGMDVDNVDQTTGMRELFAELDNAIDDVNASIKPKQEAKPEPKNVEGNNVPEEVSLDELIEPDPPKNTDVQDNQRIRQEPEIIDVENDEDFVFEETTPSEIPEFSHPDYDDKGPHNK